MEETLGMSLDCRVGDPVPLSYMMLVHYNVSDWVFQKVKELQKVVRLECEGYGD